MAQEADAHAAVGAARLEPSAPLQGGRSTDLLERTTEELHLSHKGEDNWAKLTHKAHEAK